MNEYPLTIETVQGGEVVSREVADRDALIALRSELEFLAQVRTGQSRLACIALSNPSAFDNPKTPDELHNVLVDAIHPQVSSTIERIDQNFPDIVGEICRDVIAEEAVTFQQDVAACLAASNSSRVQELSKTYALSAGLTPPSSDGEHATLDESETNMTDQHNASNPANEEELAAGNPVDSADQTSNSDDYSELENAGDLENTDGLANTGDEEMFDDVEDALKAMESDLEELQALAESDLDAPDATENVEAPVAESAISNQPQANTDTPSEEVASDAELEAVADEVIAEDRPEEVAANDAEISSEATISETSAEPTDATSNAEANSQFVEEFIAKNSSSSEGESAVAGFAASLVPDLNTPESKATDTRETETNDTASANPETARDATDNPDEAALTESVSDFNEAVAEISHGESPSRRNSAAVEESIPSGATPQPNGYQPENRSRRQPSSRGHANRAPMSNVELSIGNFADFMLGEVNGMWADARQGLEEICTVRDEIQSIRAEVSRLHQEITTMRDSVVSAKHDIRSVQSQIQNQRDDANRARQRADSAALDAQAACDRAAAAAREAESMATLSQPR